MVISTKKAVQGRKANIGGMCFDEGKMMVFVGYHACKANETGKILVTIDEARQLAKKIGTDCKTSKRQRLVKRLAKHYEII